MSQPDMIRLGPIERMRNDAHQSAALISQYKGVSLSSEEHKRSSSQLCTEAILELE